MRKKAAKQGQNGGIDKAGEIPATAAGATDTAEGQQAQEKPVFNQIAYQNEYNRMKYDRINLTMPKGRNAEFP